MICATTEDMDDNVRTVRVPVSILDMARLSAMVMTGSILTYLQTINSRAY